MDTRVNTHAVEDFTKSLDLNPNNAETLAARGFSYDKLEKFDLASHRSLIFLGLQ
jgi:Flp pilus assembly protein TadD